MPIVNCIRWRSGCRRKICASELRRRVSANAATTSRSLHSLVIPSRPRPREMRVLPRPANIVIGRGCTGVVDRSGSCPARDRHEVIRDRVGYRAPRATIPRRRGALERGEISWGRDDGAFFLVPRTWCSKSAASRVHLSLHGVVFAIFCEVRPKGRYAGSGTRDRWCAALDGTNRSNSNTSCSKSRPQAANDRCQFFSASGHHQGDGCVSFVPSCRLTQCSG